MSASLRFATVLACLVLVLAVFAGGPGTSALLSDAHVATGTISTDVDDDHVVTVDAINDSNTASENMSTDKETNGTATNETTNETATGEPDGMTDESSDDGDDREVQSLTDDESKADAEED